MDTPLAIERLGFVGSTQDEARARFTGSPLLVTATGQDVGRGRSGAEWLAADRAVAASVAFEPGWRASVMGRVPLIAGLAVTDVLPPSIGLKWPNDIVIESLKIGGILTESSDGLVVVGLGLNVFWAAPPSGMGAVYSSDPGSEHSYDVALRWARRLLDRIALGPDQWGRDEYLARCTTVGRSIEWEPDGSGRVLGVDGDGALLVDTGPRVLALHAGAVREIRPAGKLPCSRVEEV